MKVGVGDLVEITTSYGGPFRTLGLVVAKGGDNKFYDVWMIQFLGETNIYPFTEEQFIKVVNQ
jgi:hypothetical protein